MPGAFFSKLVEDLNAHDTVISMKKKMVKYNLKKSDKRIRGD